MCSFVPACNPTKAYRAPGKPHLLFSQTSLTLGSVWDSTQSLFQGTQTKGIILLMPSA